MTKKKNKEDQELTPMEELFCLEYIRQPIGARAARAAGYDEDKPQNCRNTAYNLLAKAHIKNFIKKYKHDLRHEVKIEQMDILRLCNEIMEAEVTDYVDTEKYDAVKVTKNSPNKRAIAAVKVITKTLDNGDEVRTEEVKLRDPLKAAQLAAKILGIGEDDGAEDMSIEVTVNHLAKGKTEIEVSGDGQGVEAEQIAEFDELEAPAHDITVKINKGGSK